MKNTLFNVPQHYCCRLNPNNQNIRCVAFHTAIDAVRIELTCCLDQSFGNNDQQHRRINNIITLARS
ncbi:Protein of unknown function [Lactobacillus helveticus CIRM-BIA 953]|uniref:Uncharacterized protein n=1 Tax=Lactobacillus helveticus CIRM-BIA 953 TaxID=1226335 RepID=U4QFL8_LACHE|nr:Protein of unknown function [Lactobacillus helveticus CIRM-BIA 953]CDI43357.1 Protein of unknown function [Lactobacillus helveticus CIRM-BIA 953]